MVTKSLLNLIPVEVPKNGEKKVTFTVRYDGK